MSRLPTLQNQLDYVRRQKRQPDDAADERRCDPLRLGYFIQAAAEGIKRLKRGADLPIAVLVSKVTLRKRLDIEGLVRRRIPLIVKAIQKSF